MFYNIFISIILNVKSFILLYLIYIFNILYYTIFYNNMYKNLKNENLFYYFYTKGYLIINIFLYFSKFFNIMFFYIFYIIYIYKIIKIYVLKLFIFIFKQLGIYYFFIDVLELHYSLIMKAHILKNKKYLNNISKYNFLWYYNLYNTFIFYFIYFKFCILKLNFFLFELYLWSFTYYIRFLIKIKNNKKYTIKYNIQQIKNKIYLKLSNILNKIVDKIFQNYNIKMTLKYYYNIIKKYLLNMYGKIVLNIKNFYLKIKEIYFTYVNIIFFNIFKNKGKSNTIFYYIFLFFKYLKSLFIWLWTKFIYNKIYDNLFKNSKKLKIKKTV